MSVIGTTDSANGRDGAGAGLLAAVGVQAAEERVYVALLDRPRMTASMISRKLGLPRAAVESAVATLESHGLIIEEPGSPVRYRAAPPDVAIDVLLAAKQEELARTRLAARQLCQRARKATSTGDDAGLVEIITAGLVAARRIAQSQAAAGREVLACERLRHVEDARVLESLARGVSHRVVYSRYVLESKGLLESVREFVAAGGQARVSDVPVELVIVDRETALLPVYVDGELARAVQVRSAPLVEAHVAFFEVVWSHAVPLVFTPDGEMGLAASNGDGKGAVDMAKLVPLLVAGCKDEAIARHLGVSTRTLDRRIQAFMRNLDAVTRFQAGWMAARRYGHDHDL